MFSTLSHVRLTSRVLRACIRVSCSSVNSLHSNRSFSKSCCLWQEDEGPLSHTRSSWSNNNESTATEVLARNSSRVLEIFSGNDVFSGVSEQFSPHCNGCGSVFQSEDTQKPGYITAAKNPAIQDVHSRTDPLNPVICERCFNLQNYNKGSPLVVDPDEITKFLGHIARKKALILYMVDILDLPGSLVPGLLDIVGPDKRIIIVANKLDMLPVDGNARHQYEHLHSTVLHQCQEYGLQDANVKDICIISAKTGFGIPQLVNKILDHWDEAGDIYLVGSNNAGKTSLFNALIDLTNVHKKSGDMLHRATVSRLPGTTLSLLGFTCGHWKLTKLKHRLHDGTKQYKRDLDDNEEYAIDPEIIDTQETSYKDPVTKTTSLTTDNIQDDKIELYKPQVVSGVPEREHQSWFYDTPGILNENQVTNYLTMEELKLLHSNYWLVPRTYVLKPGQAFLLGGLARVDFVNVSRMPRDCVTDQDTLTEANKSIYFTVFTSPNLPIHVLNIDKVEEFYNKHAGNQLLKVPCGGLARMATFPELQCHDFTITGIGWKESAVDIILSNIGWVSVTAGQQADVLVKAYTPNCKGVFIRQPALLPTSVNQRGKRGVRYQGHTNYSGYEGLRQASPQLVKYLGHGQHGVYQWLQEAKKKTKQQTALIRARKTEKIMARSLRGGESSGDSTLPQDGANGRRESIEKISS